jgi:hypothetical protein
VEVRSSEGLGRTLSVAVFSINDAVFNRDKAVIAGLVSASAYRAITAYAALSDTPGSCTFA